MVGFNSGVEPERRLEEVAVSVVKAEVYAGDGGRTADPGSHETARDVGLDLVRVERGEEPVLVGGDTPRVSQTADVAVNVKVERGLAAEAANGVESRGIGDRSLDKTL